jgi:hypothetical protein
MRPGRGTTASTMDFAFLARAEVVHHREIAPSTTLLSINSRFLSIEW